MEARGQAGHTSTARSDTVPEFFPGTLDTSDFGESVPVPHPHRHAVPHRRPATATKNIDNKCEMMNLAPNLLASRATLARAHTARRARRQNNRALARQRCAPAPAWRGERAAPASTCAVPRWYRNDRRHVSPSACMTCLRKSSPTSSVISLITSLRPAPG